MKRAVCILVASLLLPSMMFAETPSIGKMGSTTMADYPAAVLLVGKTPRSWHVNIDNVTGGRTLDNAVAAASGTYLGGSDNTLTPIAATIVCKDTATYWSFQNAPTTASHYLAAGGSWQPSGPDAIGYLKGITSGTDNAACSVTLWY